MTQRLKTPPKPKQPPASRNLNFENLLCAAIRDCVRVKLRYRDDMADRIFEPNAVYWTSQRKICVSGKQITNPQKPMDNLEPHNFEVGKIRAIVLTNDRFAADPRFDRFDRKYANGLICSI
jgi:hypothetical protein